MKYKFDDYLMFCKSYKRTEHLHKNKRKGPTGDDADIIFSNAEEQLFIKVSLHQ